MAGGVEDLISLLYEMVQDAFSMPLGKDKCVLDRDRVLDILEQISGQLPHDLKQARTIVESKNDVISKAKREAEDIHRQAEARARQMISQEEVLLSAKKKANEILTAADTKSREIKRVTNEYVEDALKRTEEAMNEALSEVRQTRNRFKAVAGNERQSPTPASAPQQQSQPSSIIEDI